ncbi:lysoplasmalogenase family protein [Parafannyhessea umbonata]|uniref:YhhN-like protein n=1 Tax=Parafannyhessea umbonata TaxID=604330 RepID=A0A1H1KRJ4_9ACTN|nr:lysoplasmalogenase family protein [Parafannyhessea umbonata]SDR64923.1 YhhN-like protein [Parafannyhessea umbonata]
MAPLLLVTLATAGVILQACFVRADRVGAYRRAAVLKGLAALAFVLVGATGATGGAGTVEAPRPEAVAICLGLALGAVGDVLHALRFVWPSRKRLLFNVGAASFLLGHLAYLAAVVPACAVPAWGLAASCALATAVDVAVLPRLVVQSRAELVAGGAYLAVTSAVVGFAAAGAAAVALAPAALARLAPGVALAVGTVAFLASDVMLAINNFGGVNSRRLRAASLGTYYAGQMLIALSLAV